MQSSRVGARHALATVSPMGTEVSSVPELRTDRLLLRGWRDDDRDAVAAMNADPEVMEHFPAPLSRVESDEFLDRTIERWRDGGPSWWAVEVLDGPGCIGFVGLAEVRFDAPFVPAVEVGWRLARSHWGRGYAPEAARAALEYGFDTMALDLIVSFTVVANSNSRRVMEKIGMRHDPAGDFDHPALPIGDPLRRHVLYLIDRPV